MKIVRIVVWSLLLPVFAYGALASLEPSEHLPVHPGWLAFYSLSLLTALGLLVREFRKPRRDTGGPPKQED